MTFFGILKIGPLEPCGNEFQSTGSHRLTVCTSTDSYYYISAYTWGQKRNTFPQGSNGPIFKIPKNVISYGPTELTFEWAKFFWDILRFITNLIVYFPWFWSIGCVCINVWILHLFCAVIYLKGIAALQWNNINSQSNGC